MVLFFAGLGVGLGLGVLAGLYFMQVGLETIHAAIEKITYSVRYPTPPSDPVQAPESVTEHAFDPLDVDHEQVPDWMDESYVP